MSTSTIEDKHSPYVGRWAGTSATKAFNDFTIIDISHRDGAYYLRRQDRRAFIPLEGQMAFTSENKFTAIVPTWLQAQVIVNGTFQGDGDAKVLHVNIENDGMTGLETTQVTLKQDASDYEKYQVSQAEGSSSLQLPGNDVFPDVAGPEALNMTQAQLNSAIEAMTQPPADHPDNRVEGLLILKNGQRIHESYYWGFTAQNTHIAASLTKSIVSLLAGIAYDQQLFTLDDVISDAFPEIPSTWGNSPAIQMRHVLSMTTGTTFGMRETGKMLTIDSVEKMVLASPRDHGAPGQKYHYDNGLPSLLCVFIERKSGMGIEAFAKKYLFEPLGISNYTWTRMKQKSVDGEPFVLPSGGSCLTLTDLGKIGELMLGKGMYKGTRVVSEEYIELATTRQTGEGDYPYGFYFHLNSGGWHVKGKEFEKAYMAVGSGGQIIWVAPEHSLVLVAVGSSWHDFDLTPAVVKAFGETVLKKLK